MTDLIRQARLKAPFWNLLNGSSLLNDAQRDRANLERIIKHSGFEPAEAMEAARAVLRGSTGGHPAGRRVIELFLGEAPPDRARAP